MGAETEDKIMVAPLGYFEEWTGRYTLTQPADGWTEPSFNDRSWRSGKASFGNIERMLPRTKDWQKGKIWVRRTINLSVEELHHKEFYHTDKPYHVQFRCRSVVGGYFMKMLDKRLND